MWSFGIITFDLECHRSSKYWESKATFCCQTALGAVAAGAASVVFLETEALLSGSVGLCPADPAGDDST